MTRLTSQLVMELLDRVSQPAQRVADSLRGITGAVGDANAGAAGMGQRLDAAISRNNQALASARMGMVDAAAGAYILHRALSGPVRVAAEFQSTMNRVSVVSRASGDQLDALRVQARELGRTTQFRATEVADAMSFLAMAGFDAQQVMASIPDTLNLAAAGGMELGRSADIVSNVLTGYALNVEEISQVSDILVGTFTRTNTNLEQLGTAFSYAGPIAAAAGMDFAETAAVLGRLGDAGYQGSLGGTTLRGALVRLLAPTSSAQALMESLDVSVQDVVEDGEDLDEALADSADAARQMGLQVTDAEGRMLPFVDIMRQLESHADDAGLMTRLLGTRAGPGMLALLSQGADGVQSLTEELGNLDGEAKRVADARMDGFDGMMLAFWSAVEGLQMSIGDALIPALTRMADIATDAIAPITALAEAYPDVTLAVVGATAAVIGFKVALAALRYIGLLGKGGVLSLLALGFNTIGRAAIGAHAAAKSAIGLQVALAGMEGRPITMLDRVRAGLGGIIIAVPGLGRIASGLRALGLIGLGKLAVSIGAIAAGGLMIRKHWQRIGSFFSGFADRIRERFAPELQALGERLEWLSPVVDMFAAAWREVADGVSAAWSYLSSIFEREILSEDDRARIAGAGSDWADVFIGGIERAVETRQRGLVATMADLGIGIGESLWESAQPYIAAADDWCARLVTRMESGIASGYAAIATVGGQLVQSLWDGAVRMFDAFIEWVRGIPGRIIAAIGTIDLSGAIRMPQLPGSGGGSAPGISPEDQSWLDRGAAAGWQELPARARGGRVSRGAQYQVGERGWEIFSPTRSGYIIPHHQAIQSAIARPLDLLAGLMGSGPGPGSTPSVELLSPASAGQASGGGAAQISQTFSIALNIEGSGEPRDVSRLVARVRAEIEREMREAMRAVYADTGVRTY